ncbi:2-oxo-4-hydroxy-4-carboxy-5-ureidoimidazoline decarboxylase [Salinigranum sp. GCM10025319]|uniref:2-oxo-4-hydroxy-4-carboxy-5-ureidoimidazoline decarboxylase n=1 Tax=Salinigranum sp. GCM10025319 TaxID=3252687 RepID=UPI003614A640
MSEHTIETLNDADEAAFVEALGGVYERSPWVAARAWSERPFDDVADLHACMERAVRNASRERKLELLRAHPDLGDQTEITDASEAEQSSAGLDQLTPQQYETFQRLNERYRDAFGFPFIMAVRDESPGAIRSAMERRLENTENEEFRTALNEVHEIARLRLGDRLTRV